MFGDFRVITAVSTACVRVCVCARASPRQPALGPPEGSCQQCQRALADSFRWQLLVWCES